METIAASPLKSFALRFAVFFPIFLLSRVLFGAGILRFILAFALTRWIDPVRRYKAKNRPLDTKQLADTFS
jgi:hypothetical protein